MWRCFYKRDNGTPRKTTTAKDESQWKITDSVRKPWWRVRTPTNGKTCTPNMGREYFERDRKRTLLRERERERDGHAHTHTQMV